jgi:SRSO17 transposase
MQLPIVSVAPIVLDHSENFREVFANRKQFRHFQNYLTGLIALDNKSLANLARCIVDSADKTNLSRNLSEGTWQAKRLNDKRVSYMKSQTAPLQKKATESVLAVDDTLCEHVGSLFAYIVRHYNHSNDQYPLAHNLLTSHYVSGAVRFPVDAALYRRYEEVTNWESFMKRHFPEVTIPTKAKERTALHKRVDATLRQDPAFQALETTFKTKLTLAGELVEQAVTHGLAFDWVLFDGWYLAPELLTVLSRLGKDWISILKTNRNIETNSFCLRNAEGVPVKFAEPQIQVKELIPAIPPQAYRPLTIDGTTYYTFTMTVRIAALGKVRLVVSFATPNCTGPAVVLVSNRLDCTAQRLLAAYLLRWPIETFYQDGKQLLGLDEYRMRNAQAIQKHWSLVFVAYSFLHLAVLAPSLAKGQPVPTLSIGAAARQQTQVLIQDLILFVHQALSTGQAVSQVFGSLFAKLQPTVT